MNKKLSCLRCDGLMQYIKDEKLQLGQTGWALGDLPNLLAGAMDVAIYACQSCGNNVIKKSLFLQRFILPITFLIFPFFLSRVTEILTQPIAIILGGLHNFGSYIRILSSIMKPQFLLNSRKQLCK